MGKTILGVMRKLNVTGYLKYTDRRLYMFEGFFFQTAMLEHLFEY